jgi:hypothetical protein
LLGPTHKYKRVHDLIVWPCRFLIYINHRGLCILPHKMHIYLIYNRNVLPYIEESYISLIINLIHVKCWLKKKK